MAATHLSVRLTSMSTAPPPATTFAFFTARRTIMMASCSERSASSRNCSDPPRSTIVAVRAEGHPLNRLYRSAPTWGDRQTRERQHQAACQRSALAWRTGEG
jgi:hypothetical protein